MEENVITKEKNDGTGKVARIFLHSTGNMMRVVMFYELRYEPMSTPGINQGITCLGCTYRLLLYYWECCAMSHDLYNRVSSMKCQFNYDHHTKNCVRPIPESHFSLWFLSVGISLNDS